MFINREVADEWWRMISTPPSPYVRRIKRISPHLYLQNDLNNNNVTHFFSNATLADAERFRERMIVTLLYNSEGRIPITIHPAKITDHISGRWYFMRSPVNAHHWNHWYLRVKGECLVCGDANCAIIHVSSEYRTKFCIQVHNSANDPLATKDFVMIGNDKISISAPDGGILHIDGAGNLKATKGYQGEVDLLFEDFKSRFITRAEKRVNGEVWEYVEAAQRGVGEAWELVD